MSICKALFVWGLDRGAAGIKADVPCKQRIARIENFMMSIYRKDSFVSLDGSSIRKCPDSPTLQIAAADGLGQAAYRIGVGDVFLSSNSSWFWIWVVVNREKIQVRTTKI